MRRRADWIWSSRIAAVLVLAGLADYLGSVGLDKADKLASVLSLLVAAAALVAPYLLPPSDNDHHEPQAAQHVTNTVAGDHLTQARDVKDVRVQGQAMAKPPQAPASGYAPSPRGQRGQYISGVWVGGNITQIDGADGDITIG